MKFTGNISVNSARGKALCMLMILAASAWAGNTRSIQRGTPDYAKFAMAQSHMARGDYGEAAGILSGLREIYPDDEGVGLELARAYGYGGKLFMAEEVFDSLPRDKEILLAHASVLEANDEFNHAADKYLLLLDKHPDDTEIMLKLARALEWSGRPEAAEKHYESILARHPADIGVMLRLAEIKAARGKYEPAIRICREILELEPGNIEAKLSLARFYSWDRGYSDSLRLYAELIEQEPARTLYRREKARVLGWDRKYDKSIETYRRLLETAGPDRAVEAEMRAKKNYFRMHHMSAEKYYKKWLEEEPENPEALFDLGQIYSSQKRWGKAKDAYGRILHTMPGHFRAGMAHDHAELLSGHASITAGAEYFDALSEDRNVDIQYYDYFIRAGIPLSGAFSLDMGLHETRYRFEEGETGVRGNLIDGVIKYAELPRLSAEAGLEYNRYSGDIDSRFNPRAGLHLKPADLLHLDFSFRREDIRDNYPALSDEIKKDEYRLRAESILSRRVLLGGDYTRSDYSDDNRDNRWGVDLNARLSHEPESFDLLYRYEAFGFDDESIYYFSPESFHSHRIRALWRHYLNREELFRGGLDTYYSITYEVSFDRGDETGQRAGIAFYRDITEKFSLGFEAHKTFYSPRNIYRENRAQFFLKYYL